MIKIVFLIAAFFSVTAKQMPLPPSLANKSIIHLQVQQLDNWSCGYNALYNACLLEQQAGRRTSAYSSLPYFESTCLRYLRVKGHSQQSAAYNTTLTALAAQLNLESLGCLNLDKHGAVMPLFDTSTRITYKQGLSQKEIDQLMERAIKQRVITYFTDLKQKYFTARTMCCMHFICNVQEEGVKHWILVSLIKKAPQDRVLYICDNMNRRITERSHIKKYIDYIYKFFIEG